MNKINLKSGLNFMNHKEKFKFLNTLKASEGLKHGSNVWITPSFPRLLYNGILLKKFKREIEKIQFLQIKIDFMKTDPTVFKLLTRNGNLHVVLYYLDEDLS